MDLYPPHRAARRRTNAGSDRWAARTGLAILVGGAIVVAPIAIAFAVSFLVVHLVPRPSGGPVEWLWLALILATPWLVYAGARRLARRALPLAALLRLTLVFPDRAPSRLSIARRAGGTRALERQLARDREAGRQDEPVVAAERILGLAASLNQHDRLTRGHSERVRALTDVIADQMKIPQADKDRLRWSALLHDIGKLSVPVSVLNKPVEPDEQELAVLRQHPQEGARLTAPLAEWLGPWARSIPEHHERFDGTGYPAGLAGEEISLGGRIVAVADCFETMTAVRSYKRAMTTEAARRELTECAGTHFDPVVVRAFLEASLATRSVIGAPLAALADLSRLNVLQSAGQVVASAGHFVAGVVVATGIGAATVIVAAHTGPHNGPTAAASAPVHVPATHGASQGTKVPAPTPDAGGSAAPTTTATPSPNPTTPTTTPGLPAAAVPPPPTAATSPAPVVSPTPAPSPSVTPAALPGVPTGLSVAGGDSQVTVGWSAPASNGGSAITGYVVTPFIGGVPQPAIVYASTATVQTIGGLTNGTTYTFTVAATNGVGLGNPSAPSPSVTPAALPGVPTGLSVAGGDSQVTVGWSAPASNGGSAITGYVVTPFIGGVPQPAIVYASTATVQTIGGLTNGTTYTFTVAATNGVGLGNPSAPSPSVTPAALPGVPTGLSVAGGDSQVTVGWSAPASNGGSAITGYVVTPFIGGVPQPAIVYASTATVQTIGGLTNGTTYTFTVAATNGVGLGNPSAPSPSVTPAALPGVPTGLSVAGGDSQVTVGWSAPASNGGSAITGYVVTPFIGGVPQPAIVYASTATVQTIGGLTNGTTYTFTVAATNGVGLGNPSAPSPSVTPAALPGVPTGLSVAGGDSQVTVGWSAPASNGGSAITGYVVTPLIGGVPQPAIVYASTATVQTIGGLTNGTTYTFTVAATNGVGLGPPSNESSAIVPAAVGTSVLSLENGKGTAGRVDKGDQIIVTFSSAPTPSLFCMSWSMLSYPDLTGGSVVVTGGPTAGDDTISSVSDPNCLGGFHFGSIDLGQAGYFDESTTFNDSTIHWDGVRTLTITLGPPSPGGPTNRTPSIAVYTPDPNLGVPATISSASGVQF